MKLKCKNGGEIVLNLDENKRIFYNESIHKINAPNSSILSGSIWNTPGIRLGLGHGFG